MDDSIIQKVGEIEEAVKKLGLKRYVLIDLDLGYASIACQGEDIPSVLIAISMAVWKDKHAGGNDDSTPTKALRDALELLEQALLRPEFHKCIREDVEMTNAYKELSSK